MPRYRANVKVGAFQRGDVFESVDHFHAVLASEGKLANLDEEDGLETESGWPEPQLLGVVAPEAAFDPDAASAEAHAQGQLPGHLWVK